MGKFDLKISTNSELIQILNYYKSIKFKKKKHKLIQIDTDSEFNSCFLKFHPENIAFGENVVPEFKNALFEMNLGLKELFKHVDYDQSKRLLDAPLSTSLYVFSF